MAKWPEVGDTMWWVSENLYYVPDRAAPVLEYIVTPCRCNRISLTRRGGGPYEAVLTDGHTPYYWRPGSQYGFFTAREAAEKARGLTERYERVWRHFNEEPLRRTWEVYLNGETD